MLSFTEFGALICKPKDPKCKICTNKVCKYFNQLIKLNQLTKRLKTKTTIYFVILIKKSR